MHDQKEAELRRKHYNATITSLRLIHDELMILRVRPDHPVPPYKPGQYAALGLGYWERRVTECQPEEITEEKRLGLVRRAFSISSPILGTDGLNLLPPQEEDYLEFYVALVRYSDEGDPAPPFTPRIFCLEEGDRLWISSKITGHYTLDGLPSNAAVIFCATGTGEAPHNRMIWQLLRSGYSCPLASVVCCRYRQDLAYLEVHRKLERLYPQYTYLPMTTREMPGTRRYIQDLILAGEWEGKTGVKLDPRSSHIYLCGNPAMIGIPTEYEGRTVYPKTLGMIEILETRHGFRAVRRKNPGNIHYEKYW